jgi:hypothetical protein
MHAAAAQRRRVPEQVSFVQNSDSASDFPVWYRCYGVGFVEFFFFFFFFVFFFTLVYNLMPKIFIMNNALVCSVVVTLQLLFI